MSDTREKLIESFVSYQDEYNSIVVDKSTLADHLIANGVTVQEWIPVTERLPENEKDVLICAERRYYGVKELDAKKVFVTAVAFHTDGKTKTGESAYTWDLDFVNAEYDEETDSFVIPEGWWESVRYSEEFSAVDDFVTHWMPLPEPPEEEKQKNQEKAR